MLTNPIQRELQKKLQLLEPQINLQNQIHQRKTKINKCINDLITDLKNDHKRLKQFFSSLSYQIGPLILQMELQAKFFQDTEQKLKFRREQLIKQKSQIQKENHTIHLQTQSINQTIFKMQKAIAQTILQEKQKRLRIQEQTQYSLKDIQSKIVLFEKETLFIDKENLLLTKRKKQIQEKMSMLEIQFSKKARQKDESVKKEKQELMLKLESLQGEVSEVTELNKQYSAKQKINFDKKLSLYLKAKKFGQYSASFENSAKTIEQCKQQLFKGIQRMNEAAETIAKFQIEAKELCDGFNSQFKRRDEREAKIQKLKKEKQIMRDHIIYVQNKIKSMKVNSEKNP